MNLVINPQTSSIVYSIQNVRCSIFRPTQCEGLMRHESYVGRLDWDKYRPREILAMEKATKDLVIIKLREFLDT